MENLMNGSVEEGVLHHSLPWLVEALEWLAAFIDICSIAILLIGALRFIAVFLKAEFTRDQDIRRDTIARDRIALGRYIMAALELLIVSDIIHTALSLALSDLLFLGLLVLIRSLISYFLERELHGLRQELDQ